VDKNAFDAFLWLVEHRAPAVPVINSNDEVIGVVTTRDARRVTGHQTAREMAKPLSQFFSEQPVDAAHSLGVLTCYESDALRAVACKMNVNRGHAVYVINAHDNTLIGVIVITDILKILAS